MGRPMYSHVLAARDAATAAMETTATATTPVPAEPVPHCEKWTHWNAFDPDSDEFFESENAVYEAFIDPASAPTATSPTAEDEGSPMVVDTDDPARMLADTYPLVDWDRRVLENPRHEVLLNTRSVAEPRSPLRADAYSRLFNIVGGRTEAPLPIPVPAFARRRSATVSALRPSRVSAAVADPEAGQTSPTFVGSMLRGGYVISPHPSTPPQNQEAISPPPSVTPRLYSWSTRQPPTSPSPVGASPLPIPAPRMNLTRVFS